MVIESEYSKIIEKILNNVEFLIIFYFWHLLFSFNLLLILIYNFKNVLTLLNKKYYKIFKLKKYFIKL